MKIILLENLRKIGSIGEIIDVKRGFARNYLIANKKALYASKENIKEVEKIKLDLGKKDLAHSSFVKNINLWHEEYLNNGLDAIISNTSGCGTTLKDYGFIFRDNKELKKKAKKISELTKDISEYLDENLKLEFKNSTEKYKIAYHSACSMQHGQNVHSQPINLIKKTGNEVLNIPEGHICCGSAGTYNILQQKIAKTLLMNKVKNIEKILPDFISTGNIGCMTQIASGTKIPIVHTVEVIDWLTGGPKPYKLKNI